MSYCGTKCKVEIHPLDMVREFHESFGHPVESKPISPSLKLLSLRLKLILEEVDELVKATGTKVTALEDGSYVVEVDGSSQYDPVEVADALGDILYVVYGAFLALGLPAKEVFKEIHDSNMTKLGPDGKPMYNENGKVVKGPNYRPPDIKSIIERATNNV